MAKAGKKAAQTAAAAPSNPPPPPPPASMAEDEPQLDFEEEEMDDATLRSTLGTLQEELASLRANQETAAEAMARQQQELDHQRAELSERQAEVDRRQTEAMAALEAALLLARNQAAPASQPNQPENGPPQGGPNPSPPIHPSSPQRPEQPQMPHDDVPLDPEADPPSQAARGNPPQQRQNRVERQPRSPRRRENDGPHQANRGHYPPGNRRDLELGSAVRGPQRHDNARGHRDQRRPPSNARGVSARDGNRGNNQSYHSQSKFKDGHGYNEADSCKDNADGRNGNRGKSRSQIPQDDQPNRQDAGGQPRQNNVFNRLGGSEQRRREEDLRDILNDRREKHGENIPPAAETVAIPTALQAQIDALNQAVQQLVGGRTSYIDHDRRKGTPFIQRIANAETPSKFKMPTLPNFDGYGDPVLHVNKFEIQMDIQKVSEDAKIWLSCTITSIPRGMKKLISTSMIRSRQCETLTFSRISGWCKKYFVTFMNAISETIVSIKSFLPSTGIGALSAREAEGRANVSVGEKGKSVTHASHISFGLSFL
ncbi:RNA polymerase II degradation factor 1-like [Humulus lupulus]|uniref:RNA polymerase II degradation factor 1-like n=1 Tax=Humulus lupulus TaxID=3486 RepID=UPI002B41368A|nr:RNA polymerase II degradation factor 1-like [Humulus lupulus]